ncbi:hypothetical protein [Kineosporia sp. NBRC 101731]|uniref:hypothetical protein n=1 Tax=Kineosporia sp. NBRC 101731 TaxID=3032199 RepID=UPI0024A13096|nr:hypothetical protein [Kineosporia sp. NBRC 101731]GLY32030.1 hypothetical protein Kisp02_53950 [Kineosporia sp. NBRC 101731]
MDNLTLDQLGDLLTKAAAEGIRIGKARTDGDHTDAGIAGHILMEAGLIGSQAQFDWLGDPFPAGFRGTVKEAAGVVRGAHPGADVQVLSPRLVTVIEQNGDQETFLGLDSVTRQHADAGVVDAMGVQP